MTEAQRAMHMPCGQKEHLAKTQVGLSFMDNDTIAGIHATEWVDKSIPEPTRSRTVAAAKMLALVWLDAGGSAAPEVQAMDLSSIAAAS